MCSSADNDPLCCVFTHHAGQCEQCGLDLSHVPIFKQVIGLKDVIGLQAIGQDGFDEIPKVFQLQRATEKKKKRSDGGWDRESNKTRRKQQQAVSEELRD